jgi:hypothetical protein
MLRVQVSPSHSWQRSGRLCTEKKTSDAQAQQTRCPPVGRVVQSRAAPTVARKTGSKVVRSTDFPREARHPGFIGSLLVFECYSLIPIFKKYNKGICVPMFIAAFVTIDQRWEDPHVR